MPRHGREGRTAVLGEAHARIPEVPHREPVLEERAADEVQAVVRVDERLAHGRGARNRAGVELLGRDRQVELGAGVHVREGDVDLRGQRGDLRARDAVLAVVADRLDVGRDERVDRLGGGRREEHIARAAVEHDLTRGLERRRRLPVDVDGGGGELPVAGVIGDRRVVKRACDTAGSDRVQV
jgi:hypothetical protein